MLSLLALVAAVAAEKWAVIAVGSAGYGNYRHHADGCHAYKLLVRNGLSPSRIILMMAGDVPYLTSNRFYGKLYNHPGTMKTSIRDVFDGCHASYLGHSVTKDLFLAVITGNAERARHLSGLDDAPVLKSGLKDTVFINFVDHGGTGCLAFPFGSLLVARELYAALGTMSKNHLYKQMLLYIEACESGSMFYRKDLIPPGVLALTAANSTSSYATYCPPYDVVLNTEMGTCLGDEFSVHWMEDSDRHREHETIREQFLLVRNETTGSRVTAWGDEAIEKEQLKTFIGSIPKTEKHVNYDASVTGDVGLVPSRDVELHLAQYRYARAAQEDKPVLEGELYEILKRRREVKERFEKIVKLSCRDDETCIASASAEVSMDFDIDCHAALVEAMESCGWDSYAMSFSSTLAQLCTITRDVRHLTSVIDSVCEKKILEIVV